MVRAKAKIEDRTIAGIFILQDRDLQKMLFKMYGI